MTGEQKFLVIVLVAFFACLAATSFAPKEPKCPPKAPGAAGEVKP